jgi:hypothetical protein
VGAHDGGSGRVGVDLSWVRGWGWALGSGGALSLGFGLMSHDLRIRFSFRFYYFDIFS